MTRTIPTPIGVLRAETDGAAITALEPCNEGVYADAHPLLLQLERELGEYFTCKRRSFTLPLAPQGSAFAQVAWRVLQEIPYGETISYKTQAALMGRPSAVRACANANGRNPIMILIPCHRVIAHDGSLGGYSGGVQIKRFLLELEAGAAKQPLPSARRHDKYGCAIISAFY